MVIDRDTVSCLEVLRNVLDKHRVKCILMGAQILGLHFGSLARKTRDVDLVIYVRSWKRFEELKKELVDNGFRRAPEPHRMRFRKNAIVDLIPYHPSLVREGRLVWPGGTAEMNLAGYHRLFESSEPMEIVPGLILPVAPLPLFVILKMVSYEDSQRERDLADISSCLEHYEEEPEASRRYQVINRDIDWDTAGAYMLGNEAARFLDDELREAVGAFLARFTDIDAPEIDHMLRARGERMGKNEKRQEALSLLRAFQKGLEESENQPRSAVPA